MKKLNEKYERELKFWITRWTNTLKKEWWSKDISQLLKIKNNPNLYSYEQRMKHESKALFLRLLKETGMKNNKFLKDKIVVDIGPGPMGLLEGSDARVKVAVEPLAEEFKKHNLLLKDSDVVYLNQPAEKIPLLDEFADVVISRNNLDHVENPEKVMQEAYRILKPKGYLILNVDINHPPLVAEPHKITQAIIKKMTKDLKLIRKTINKKPHGWKGQMFIGLYQKI